MDVDRGWIDEDERGWMWIFDGLTGMKEMDLDGCGWISMDDGWRRMVVDVNGCEWMWIHAGGCGWKWIDVNGWG